VPEHAFGWIQGAPHPRTTRLFLWDASGGFADQLDVAKNGVLHQLIRLELRTVQISAVAHGTMGKPIHILRIEAPIAFWIAVRG
jgi:hypothetical protein